MGITITVAVPELFKYAAEVRTYTFDFSQLDELMEGDTISSIVSISASPTGLTIGSQVISAKTVEVVLSGGSSGTSYTVSAIITTSSGATLEGQGTLSVL